MGSDTETALVTEENLKRMIRLELEKRQNGETNFDDRLTGTWNQEVFCDSDDEEEVVADVLRKRMSTCSTYAGVNDLILLPDNPEVMTREDHLENVVFHIWNQYGFYRDVIVGEAYFKRYFVRFESGGPMGLVEEGMWNEFTEYRMKRVLENHYFVGNIDQLLEQESDRLQRTLKSIERRQKSGGSEKTGAGSRESGKYIYELVDVGLDMYRRWEEESRATIEKFSKPIIGEDHYLEHLYRGYETEWGGREMQSDLEALQKRDYRQLPYEYPLAAGDNLGILFTHHREASSYYRYDELFQKGLDMECLMANLTGSAKQWEKPEDINVIRTLRNVYAYD